MSDVRSGRSEDDNENSCDSDDQQELESYLYSLVHHDSSVGEDKAQGCVEEIPPPGQDNPNGPQKGWRYFNRDSNVTSYSSRNDSFSKRLEELSERYNCTSYRDRGCLSRKNPYWRRPQNTSNRPEEMDHPRHRPYKQSPNFSETRSSYRADTRSAFNVTNVQSSPETTNARSSSNIANTKNSPRKTFPRSSNVTIPNNLELQEISGSPAYQKNDSEVKENTSLSSESVSPEIPSCSENQREDENNLNKENSGGEKPGVVIAEKEDLMNTDPTLSSTDVCFELPQTSFTKPKSKSSPNLNECMTQVLGSMLDEDASRSSMESDKRPVQKPSKNSSASGWTVGMSWEDMSSKFRFNFEVDSVCGDSVKEGSLSSSRANSPEASAVAIPEEECPADVTKYDVSLKTKEDASESMAVSEESDSDVESVVEVSQPQREPPPVVEISSDTEDVVPAKIIVSKVCFSQSFMSI